MEKLFYYGLLALLAIIIFWKQALNFSLYFIPKYREIDGKIVNLSSEKKYLNVPQVLEDNLNSQFVNTKLYEYLEYYIEVETKKKLVKIQIEKSTYNFLKKGERFIFKCKKFSWDDYYTIVN